MKTTGDKTQPIGGYEPDVVTGIRYTSQENKDTGKFDVLKVTDGPSYQSAKTEVESSHDTSQQANDRIRELTAEKVKAERTPAEDSPKSARKK